MTMKWLLIIISIIFLFGTIGEKNFKEKIIYLIGIGITLTLSVILHIYE